MLIIFWKLILRFLLIHDNSSSEILTPIFVTTSSSTLISKRCNLCTLNKRRPTCILLNLSLMLLFINVLLIGLSCTSVRVVSQYLRVIGYLNETTRALACYTALLCISYFYCNTSMKKSIWARNIHCVKSMRPLNNNMWSNNLFLSFENKFYKTCVIMKYSKYNIQEHN